MKTGNHHAIKLQRLSSDSILHSLFTLTAGNHQTFHRLKKVYITLLNILWTQHTQWLHTRSHAYDLTHTCLFLMYSIQNITSHTHTQNAPVWNAVRVNMYSKCWCSNLIWPAVSLANWTNITCTHTHTHSTWKNIYKEVI